MKRYFNYLAKTYSSICKNGIDYTIKKIKRILHTKGDKLSSFDLNALINNVTYMNIEENIKFSIITPLYNTNAVYLRELIESVINQKYCNWELCLVDASNNTNDLYKIISSYQDTRIKYSRLRDNFGIAANTNIAIAMSSGEYICFLDHDDILTANALYENALAIQDNEYDVLYSDECHYRNGKLVVPFFKPDWSRELLYSQNYICHFLVVNKKLVNKVGGLSTKYDGSQDYDFILKLSEFTNDFYHIPKILYLWRESETSTASTPSSKPYAHNAGKNALDAHLKRMYNVRAYAGETEYDLVYEPHFGILFDEKASIIIPMKDNVELTKKCVDSIIKNTDYPNYEIIILDNNSIEKVTFDWFNYISQNIKNIKIVKADMEFNWSKLNNYGISKATGDVFVFLNNDTIIKSKKWLELLMENALRDEIGCVGPLLMYEDMTIQHAGVVVGMYGVADHIFKGMDMVHYTSPYVSPMVSRNVLAITGACMAISRKTIDDIGGFDEEFIICGSDVEICLRAYENGYKNKYVASVSLFHLESKSRDKFIPKNDFIKSKQAYEQYICNGDPYFNRNLDYNSYIPRMCKNAETKNF